MRARRWAQLVQVLLYGYLPIGKFFAYIGIPSLKIFIGEIVLGAFLLFRSSEGLGRWFRAIFRPDILGEYALALLVFVSYGVFEIIRGLSFGHDVVRTIQNFAVNYYPLYFFLGLWASQNSPELLPKTIRILGWWTGIYGFLCIFVFRGFEITMPGQPGAVLFSQPTGALPALIGLLFFEPILSKVWVPLLMNAFILLSVQVRQDWVAFIFTIFAWSFLTHRFNRLIGGVFSIAALLIAGYYSNVKIPGPRGVISTRDIVGRAVSSVDPSAAGDLGGVKKQTKEAAGTVQWRTKWWHAIWVAVNEEYETSVFGFGYGYVLGDLVSYMRGSDTRTPHNIFYYTLGYTGWLGVFLLAVFQGALCRLMLRAYRETGQSFGFALWVSGVTSACFGNFLETPFNAIPFYLLCGIAIGPLARKKEFVSYANPLRTQLLSTARG